MFSSPSLYLTIALAPLLGAILAGLFGTGFLGRQVSRRNSHILTIALVVFAFTTILGWSYFGEKCWEFLVGTKAIWPFRVIWVLAVPFGAIAQLDFAWLLADTLNGLMAIPNLVSLLLLSPVVVKLTKEYFARS